MNKEVLEVINNYFPREKIRFYHADKKYSSTKGNYFAVVGNKEIFIKIAGVNKLRDIVEGHKKWKVFILFLDFL